VPNVPRPRVDAIDVAHYQYVVDEALIPHLPVMTCKGSEGARYKDPTRPNWLRIFRTRAEVLGMYHWIRSDSPMDAQVQNLAGCYRQESVLPRDGELAPGWVVQLDWERTIGLRDLTVAEIEEWHHYANITFGPGRVITYASDWVPNFTTWRARHPDLPVWYANYSLSDLPSGGQQESAKYKACLWQWSSQVMVPGIDTVSRPGIDVSEIENLEQILEAAHVAAKPPVPPTPHPPSEEPLTPYVFQLADGGIGIRHESGSRSVNAGELEGPLAGETVHQIPKGSNWEGWVLKELAKYQRDLDPAAVPTVVFPPQQVHLTGTVGPT